MDKQTGKRYLRRALYPGVGIGWHVCLSVWLNQRLSMPGRHRRRFWHLLYCESVVATQAGL